MNTANLELCKELYELSGWGDGTDMNKLKWLDYYEDWSVPAYDLGYLLRKLPSDVDGYPLTIQALNGWQASLCYDGAEDVFMHKAEAETPEDAACRLAIELFKQGILSRG